SKSLFSYDLPSTPGVPGTSLQIPPAATVGLIAGLVSPDLRQAFTNHGESLSGDSQLTVRSAPGGWTLTDRGTGKVYRIYGKSFLASDGQEDPGDLKVYLDSTRLFSTSASKVIDNLNNGVVSKDLRAVFKNQGYTLPSTVTVVTTSFCWEVTDPTSGTVYQIFNENGQLRVSNKAGIGSTVNAGGAVSVTANDRRLLFNVSSGYTGDLDGGTVPSGLKSDFETNGIKLSSN